MTHVLMVPKDLFDAGVKAGVIFIGLGGQYVCCGAIVKVIDDRFPFEIELDRLRIQRDRERFEDWISKHSRDWRRG